MSTSSNKVLMKIKMNARDWACEHVNSCVFVCERDIERERATTCKFRLHFFSGKDKKGWMPITLVWSVTVFVSVCVIVWESLSVYVLYVCVLCVYQGLTLAPAHPPNAVEIWPWRATPSLATVLWQVVYNTVQYSFTVFWSIVCLLISLLAI